MKSFWNHRWQQYAMAPIALPVPDPAASSELPMKRNYTNL